MPPFFLRPRNTIGETRRHARRFKCGKYELFL